MWRTIIVGGYKIVVKIYDTGSKYGIKEFPRISKLEIWKSKEILAQYDRGWVFNKLPRMVYRAIMKVLEVLL